jgi:hypothetical protein
MKQLRNLAIAAYALAPIVAYADVKGDACSGALGNSGCAIPNGGRALMDVIKSVTTTLIFVVGAVAVIMIIIGGLRYVLSGGDSAGTKSAKDTILYAIIGLVVAVVAYGIVAFVLKWIA